MAFEPHPPVPSSWRMSRWVALHIAVSIPSKCDPPLQVHESSVLGEVGKGYKYSIEVLNAGRIGIGAQMLGIAEGVLGHTVPYLQERKAFGQPVADFQVARLELWSAVGCGTP